MPIEYLSPMFLAKKIVIISGMMSCIEPVVSITSTVMLMVMRVVPPSMDAAPCKQNTPSVKSPIQTIAKDCQKLPKDCQKNCQKNAKNKNKLTITAYACRSTTMSDPVLMTMARTTRPTICPPAAPTASDGTNSPVGAPMPYVHVISAYMKRKYVMSCKQNTTSV